MLLNRYVRVRDNVLAAIAFGISSFVFVCNLGICQLGWDNYKSTSRESNTYNNDIFSSSILNSTHLRFNEDSGWFFDSEFLTENNNENTFDLISDYQFAFDSSANSPSSPAINPDPIPQGSTKLIFFKNSSDQDNGALSCVLQLINNTDFKNDGENIVKLKEILKQITKQAQDYKVLNPTVDTINATTVLNQYIEELENNGGLLNVVERQVAMEMKDYDNLQPDLKTPKDIATRIIAKLSRINNGPLSYGIAAWTNYQDIRELPLFSGNDLDRIDLTSCDAIKEALEAKYQGLCNFGDNVPIIIDLPVNKLASLIPQSADDVINQHNFVREELVIDLGSARKQLELSDCICRYYTKEELDTGVIDPGSSGQYVYYHLHNIDSSTNMRLYIGFDSSQPTQITLPKDLSSIFAIDSNGGRLLPSYLQYTCDAVW